MSSLSDLLGASGAPIVLEHNGRKYKCGALTQRVKSAFKSWLVSRAMEAAGDSDRAISVVTRDASKGLYSWGSVHCQEALLGLDGALALACMLFGVNEDEMMDLLKHKPAQVKGLIRLSLLESTPIEDRERLLAAMNKDDDGGPESPLVPGNDSA